MLRTLSCAVAALLVCGAVVLAAEPFGFLITEVKDDTITGYKTKGKEKDEKTTTFKVAKDAKITKGMFDKDKKMFVEGDPIEGGLKNEMFTKIDKEKGLRVRVTTEGEGDKEMVTKISTFTRPGK